MLLTISNHKGEQAMEFSIKPVTTEQASAIADKDNFYTFAVSPNANKPQIKKMVEELYGVKVIRVNTSVVRPERKQRWTKSGLLRGKTERWKKAMVKIADGQTIDFFSNL